MFTKDELRQQAIRDLEEVSVEYRLEMKELADKGYRPDVCFHGTNLWVDHDPICGGCEDGEYDPRYHTINSPEFQEEVDNIVRHKMRNQRLDLAIEMIQEQANSMRTESDIRALQATVNVFVDRIRNA